MPLLCYNTTFPLLDFVTIISRSYKTSCIPLQSSHVPFLLPVLQRSTNLGLLERHEVFWNSWRIILCFMTCIKDVSLDKVARDAGFSAQLRGCFYLVDSYQMITNGLNSAVPFCLDPWPPCADLSDALKPRWGFMPLVIVIAGCGPNIQSQLIVQLPLSQLNTISKEQSASNTL